MIVFIDEGRKRWGVEPICRVLPIAPSTYYAAKKRAPSERALRDEYLKLQVERVWTTSRSTAPTRSGPSSTAKASSSLAAPSSG